MARKNDWVATMLYNQPSSFDEVIANGITPDNSQILSKDEYKNKEAIQEAFTENGKFNEVAFDNFYNSALSMYNQFAHEDWTEKLVSEMDKDPLDWTQPLKTNVKDVSVKVKNGNNPERRSMGITGIGSVGDPVFSIREIAQDNNVRDINGNVLDWTPNQKGLGTLFAPTLALATYDEDGTHKENGITVAHKAGDYKRDGNGDFYYEELGNREGYNKEILHVLDVLTTDGTTLNKFDVFDADGLTKSAGSVIARTALQFAPFLIPGVREWYGAMGAAFNFASVMPTFAKSINSIVTGSNDNEFGKTLNKIDNWFGRFDESSSDYARQNFASLENIGNILSSSAKQLYQQKSLANLSKILYKNDALRQRNVGKIISLGYMAATSSEEVYADFKRAGASDTVAGLGMLASTAALYGLLNNDYFKDQLFKGTFLDESEARDVVKNFNITEVERVLEARVPKIATKNDAAKAFTGLHDWFSEKWAKFIKKPVSGVKQELPAVNHPVNKKLWSSGARTLNRAINEGVEETMEEVAFDATKGFFSALDALGVPTTENPNTSLDFGFSLEDTLTRYAASFVGGALGGAVFEGLNMYERLGSKVVELSDLESTQQMIYMVETGRAQELRDAVDALYKRKKLGNENLSASKTAKDSEGNTIWAQGDDSDNQNKFARDALMAQIDVYEDILQKNGLTLMMYEYQGQMLNNDIFKEEFDKQQKTQANEKIDAAEYMQRYKHNARIKAMERFKLHTTFINDLVKLGQDIVTAETELRKLKSTEPDKDSDVSKKQESIKFWENRLKELELKRKEFSEGKHLHKYVFQTQFIADPTQHDPFMGSETILVSRKPVQNAFWSMTLEGYVKTKTGRNYSQLSDVEKSFYEKEYKELKNGDFIDKLGRAANLKYELDERLAPAILAAMTKLEGKNLDNYHAHESIVSQSSDFQAYEKLSAEVLDAQEHIDKLIARLKELEAAGQTSGEEYTGLNEELAEKITTVETIETALETYRDLYGIESAKDFGQVLLNESITEEGKKGLYETLLENIRSIKEYDSWRVIAQNLENSQGALANAEGLDKKDYQDAIKIDQAALKEISTRFNEMADEILAYYTHLKDNELVSDNNFALDRFMQLLFEPIAADLYDYVHSFLFVKATEHIFEPEDYPLKEDLETGIYDILHNLSTKDYTNALTRFNDLVTKTVEVYADEGFQGDANADLLKAISAFTNGFDVISFIKKIDAMKASITTFSISEILKDLSLDVDGTILKVLDILEAEGKSLTSMSADAYLTSNPLYLNALEQIPKLMEIISTAIASSYNGQNEFINKYRSKAGIDLLAEGMSESTKNIIISDIVNIGTKAETLLNLHKNNVMKKKQFHKKSEIKLKTDFTKKLLFEKDSPESFISRLSKGLDVDVEKYLLDALNENNISITDVMNDNISESDLKNLNKALIQFGDKLYDALDHSPESLVKYGKALAQLLPADSYELNFGEITDDKTVPYSDLAAVVYMATLIGNKSSVFASHLQQVAYSKDAKFVPIIGQEVNVQIGVAMMNAPELFNQITEHLTTILPDGLKDDTEKYMKNRTALYNFMFIQGSAGSGKSKVVAKYIADIIRLQHKDAEIISAAPTASQIQVISESVGSKTSCTFDELFEKIAPGSSTQKTEKSNGHLIYESEPKIEKTDLFNDASGKKVLILDESTFIPERNLKILIDWAKENNVFVFGLGDRKQNGNTELFETEVATSSIEDCVYLSGPELTESIRVANIAKLSNLSKLNSIITKITKQYKKEPWLEESDLAQMASDMLKNIKHTLVFSEKSGQHFVGEKFISSDQVDHYVTEFLNLSTEARKDLEGDEKNPSVLLITDEPSKYAHYESKGVVVASAKVAQGGEFDYVIVDKQFKIDDNQYRSVRDFYTTASRSRIGTVIVDDDNSIRRGFNIDNKESDDSLINEPASFVTDADDHIKWKTEIMEHVTGETSSSDDTDGESDDDDDGETDDGKPKDDPKNHDIKIDGKSAKDDPSIVLKKVFEGGSSAEDYSDVDGDGKGAPKPAEKNPAKDEKENADKIKATLGSTPAKKLSEARKKKVGTATYDRSKFIDIIDLWEDFGEGDLELSEIHQWRRFSKLFSSAVMYNLHLEARHVKKLVAENHSRFDDIDAFVSAWNSKERRFSAKYYDTHKGSIVFYETGTAKIPVAFVKQELNGFVTVPAGESLFAENTPLYGVDSSRLTDGDVKLKIDVPISSVFKTGHLYSFNRIFAQPKEQSTPNAYPGFKSNINQEFRDNKGKTYTVWSDCEILTDEDIESIFKYRYDKDGNKILYIDAEPVEVKLGHHKPGRAYRLNNGALVMLIGNHRSISLSEAYDISCIVKYIAGHLTFNQLSDHQRKLFGGLDKKHEAIKYVKSILGDFEYDVLHHVADANKRKRLLAENFKSLKYTFKLFSSDASDKIIGNVAVALQKLGNEKQFYNNLFRYIGTNSYSQSSDAKFTHEWQITVNGDSKKQYVVRYNRSDIKPSDSKWEIFELKNDFSTEFVTSIEAKGEGKSAFINIMTTIDPDFKMDDLVSKTTIQLGHSSISNGKTYHDIESDYDHVVTMFKGTNVEFSSLEKEFRDGYFSHGIFINDKGAAYQPGIDTKENVDQTAWRVHRITDTVERLSAFVKAESSTFVIDNKYEFKEVETGGTDDTGSGANDENINQEIRESQDFIVSLLRSYLGEIYLSDVDFQNKVKEVFADSQNSDDPITFMVEEVNKLVNLHGYTMFLQDGIINMDTIQTSNFNETEDEDGNIIYQVRIDDNWSDDYSEIITTVRELNPEIDYTNYNQVAQFITDYANDLDPEQYMQLLDYFDVLKNLDQINNNEPDNNCID